MIKVKTKILITGGAGFIGSHLTDRLLAKNFQVIVADDLSKGKKENINKKASFIKANVCSEYFLSLLEEIKPDFIFHLAAQTSIDKSVKNPARDLQINLFAPLYLLETIKRMKVQKIIFASSAAIYQETNSLPIKEEAAKIPISIYGMEKLLSEYLFKNFYGQHKIPYVILRLANVYGERQDSSAEGGVVAIFIDKILNGKTVEIYGDGKQTRDFIYISDVILANLAVLERKIIGEFNIGTEIQTQINELDRKLQKIAKLNFKKQYKSFPHLEIKNNSLSYTKLKNATGWYPKVSLEDGLRKTFEYFKSKLR